MNNESPILKSIELLKEWQEQELWFDWVSSSEIVYCVFCDEKAFIEHLDTFIHKPDCLYRRTQELLDNISKV